MSALIAAISKLATVNMSLIAQARPLSWLMPERSNSPIKRLE
jgi:hypothetical protein